MNEEELKQGYQPKGCNLKNIVPPSVSTNVKPKKDGYTWEDLDKAWWEGFDNAKNKMEKRIAELEVQIERMKCGGNCKHLYHVNTGGCYDAKCDLTGCDCTNCKDEWELRR